MSEPGRPRSRARFVVPNLVTFASIGIGWAAITLCLRGEPVLAAWIGLIACFTDRLDGILARALEAQSELGVQLDSLADLVSFGVAPAVIGFSFFSGRSGWPPWLLATVCGLHLGCGAMRLAIFNVRSAAGIKGEYLGFPTTLMAGTVYTFLLTLAAHLPVFAPPRSGWAYITSLADDPWRGLHALAPFLPLIFVLSAIGMVAPLRVPRLGKPRHKVMVPIVLLVVTVGIVLVLLRTLPEYGLGCCLAWVGFSVVGHVRARPAPPA